MTTIDTIMLLIMLPTAVFALLFSAEFVPVKTEEPGEWK